MRGARPEPPGRGRDRAVSTVIDVALALLLISASVLVIGLYLADDGDSLADSDAERTAETLGGTTISVTYDLEDTTESTHYEKPEAVDGYERTTYGSATGLLAEAAVTNATIDGERPVPYADAFADGVAGSVAGRLVGSDRRVHVVADWRPYEGASIRGETTVGRRPPPTADASVATTTASSGMPEVDGAELAAAYADNESVDAIAEPIARSIVRGYFPPERTQLALERRTLDRAVATTRYLELAALVDRGDDLERDSGPLARSDARADDANAVLVDGLTDLIADDLDSGPVGAELDAIGDDEDRLEAYFEKHIAPGDVEIAVYTWESRS